MIQANPSNFHARFLRDKNRYPGRFGPIRTLGNVTLSDSERLKPSILTFDTERFHEAVKLGSGDLQNLGCLGQVALAALDRISDDVS